MNFEIRNKEGQAKNENFIKQTEQSNIFQIKTMGYTGPQKQENRKFQNELKKSFFINKINLVMTKIMGHGKPIFMKYIIACLLLFIALPTKAEVYVWQDPKFDITLTFPQGWMRQAKEGEDLRLHILAPQGQDHAACRVLANNDNRFLYVPPQGAVEVSAFVQDEKALRGVLANRLRYDNVNLIGYQNIAGLGKGPATMAIGQFTKNWNGQAHKMQSVVFGGYSQGLETVFQCESTQAAWGKWQPLFMGMASSFDYPARNSVVKNGHYRDFMADGFVYFPVGNQQGVARY